LFCFVVPSGWVKKQKRYLLIFACIVSVLWILFFCYYNYRTLTVSGKNFQHEFHTNKDDTRGIHQRHFYNEQKRSSLNNDSQNTVLDVHNVNDRVRERTYTDNTSYNRLLLTVHSPLAPILHNYSHFRDDVRRHQYSKSRDESDPVKLLPGWLRSDPSVQQLLAARNVSQPSLKHRVTEDIDTAAQYVLTLPKPMSTPMLASGRKPSGFFDIDIQHSADRYGRVVLSVVDSGYVNFAVNFQRLSVDTVGLENFLFICTDQQAVVMLQRNGIACSYFEEPAEIQVV